MAPFLSRSENTLNLIIEDSLYCVHCCLQEQVGNATMVPAPLQSSLAKVCNFCHWAAGKVER